jgi:hypothetical protein
MHVVATLRIAEHISAGKQEIGALAAAAGCDAYVLHRVMTHLAGKGVFEEPTSGHFALNDCSRSLLEPMMTLGLDLDGFGGRMAYVWGTLLQLVRTGKPAYASIFGRPFFDDLDAHPEIGAKFDALLGPAGHGTPRANFEITGGWDAVQTVVDVGGGTGALLAELLRLHPQLRGTLVDRPQTVARAGEILRSAGVSERVASVGQSFFDPLPGGADLYLLKSVINDWPDREATLILRRCAEAARPKGRVVVLGGVTNDGEPRGLMIEMVLVGGKLRTISEFRELARDAGLEVVAAGKQPMGAFITECRTRNGG